MTSRAKAEGWYGLGIWRKRSKAQLSREPLCCRCIAKGVITPATEANHNPKHNDDWQAFINGPLESVCKPCHDGEIRAEERSGIVGHGADGRPKDAAHPWNR